MITVDIPYSALRGICMFGGQARLEIDSDIGIDEINRLTTEYRNLKEGEKSYEGFINFLKENDIGAKILEPTYTVKEF